MADSGVQEKQDGRKQSQETPSEEADKQNAFTEEADRLKKENMLKRLWTKAGLNVGILLMMFKGALPPTIALAVYQVSAFAAIYSTLGYLVAIMSVLSLCILPRSKFIQTMLLNVIGVCIGAAVALLQIYCSVQARAHTTHKPAATSNGPSPGAAVTGYNSSASAVSAIWLFFNIYVVNTLRASRPQLQLPVILYSIFANVAGVYAPSFPTMAAGIKFTERLLECFLTGFGIATAVSLLVFPTTVRMTWFKQSAEFIQTVQVALKTQMRYFQTLERNDMFNRHEESDDGHQEDKLKRHRKPHAAQIPTDIETYNLKATIEGLGDLMGKMHADIAFAKRETAWGKLKASELEELFKLLQGIMLPLSGMASTADIFERLARRWGWTGDQSESSRARRAQSEKIKTQWNEIMVSLHDPFASMTSDMHDGLQHVLYVLELAKPLGKKNKTNNANKAAKGSEDVEASAGAIEPGNYGYGEYLAKRVDRFHEHRRSTIRALCEKKGVKLNTGNTLTQTDSTFEFQQEQTALSAEQEQRQSNKRQLFLVLYMDYLLWSTGKAVLKLVQYADHKVEDGTMKKSRLIVPGQRRTRKWILSLLNHGDSTTEHAPDSAESGSAIITSGSSFGDAKDPEHLVPATAWQRGSNYFRRFGRSLGSIESAHGFRVACATMSIAIVAYLEDTREFFLEQRIVWAMVMVAIGMTVTAGSGVFGFIGRIAGTFIAMCTSLIIWYIVNGHPAGVIAFVFVFVFFQTYFLLKYPRFLIIALLSIVTQVLIIGYELEVKKVGIKVATSNGQPAYPTYELAPYRLACVAGGMFVAFFWTFFPYPLTDRSQLRKHLGESLYLLANYYSIVHTTSGLRLQGAEGDMSSKASPGRRIDKARRDVYIKELALLSGIKQHSTFTAWEPTFGGKFPKEQYDTIIQETQNILNYLALVSYASISFSHDPTTSPDRATWINDFARLIGTLDTTSQTVTSTLALLSAAVTNGNPLPPYLHPPQQFKLSQRLEALDPDILSVNHLEEPGYAAFAVMQIASSLVSDDLGKLIGNVRDLVGEVDFAFHVVSTANGDGEGPSGKGKKD